MADMAQGRRLPARPLIEELFAEPYRFELLQAIALLERAGLGTVQPLGTGIDPLLESVRLEQDCTLGFPASDVSSLKAGPDGRPVLKTPVLGLSGLGGPLPYAYTEGILERLSRRDRAGAAFLDLFNHRLLSIFYRIYRSALPLLDGHPEHSVVAFALKALIGIGSPGLSGRLASVPDRILLSTAGILADRRRSAAGLETVLAAAFASRVQVKSFEGGWLELAEDSRTVLGRKGSGDSLTLGGGAVLGTRVWDQHAGFVVVFQFDKLAAYEEMFPIGRHFDQAVSLCRFYAGLHVDIHFELRLLAKATPPLRISARDGRRLGWNSWILGGAGVAGKDGRIRFKVPAIEGGTGYEH